MNNAAKVKQCGGAYTMLRRLHNAAAVTQCGGGEQCGGDESMRWHGSSEIDCNGVHFHGLQYIMKVGTYE